MLGGTKISWRPRSLQLSGFLLAQDPVSGEKLLVMLKAVLINPTLLARNHSLAAQEGLCFIEVF